MEQLKNVRKITIAITRMVLSLLLTACQEEDPNIGAKSLGVAKIEDFRKVGNVLTQEQGEKLGEDSRLGSTKESALVMLIFDENGKLYTQEKYAKDFEKIIDKSIKPTYYYTDLQTFKTVTNFKYATIDYVLDISDNETSHYVLDYLRKEQIPTIERERRVMEKIQNDMKNNSIAKASGISLAATPFKNCDILVGKWKTGNSYGHACVVYNEANACYTTLNAYISATTTFDAWGSEPNPADDIGTHNMSQYWSSSNISYRYYLKPKIDLTANQKTIIKNYLALQDSDTYNWTCNLSTENTWYCSKLVWKSYKQIGRDIGQNPLVFVTPMDIAGDTDLMFQIF